MRVACPQISVIKDVRTIQSLRQLLRQTKRRERRPRSEDNVDVFRRESRTGFRGVRDPARFALDSSRSREPPAHPPENPREPVFAQFRLDGQQRTPTMAGSHATNALARKIIVGVQPYLWPRPGRL